MNFGCAIGIITIATRAPVLGLEDYPDLWLPATTLLEFGTNYCIDYTYCRGYQSFAIARVYKTPEPAIAHPAPLEIGCLYPFGTVDFVLLSGTPIASVYGARPDDYVQEGDALVLCQPSDGVEFALVLGGERPTRLRWATERLRAAYTLEAFHPDLRQLLAYTCLQGLGRSPTCWRRGLAPCQPCLWRCGAS